MKRISYNIIYDTIYTFLCTILITPIFASVIRFLFSPSIPYFPYVIVLYISFIIPAILLSIRPVFGLFKFPDTIYLSKNEKLFFYDKITELKISDIKEIHVNRIGAGSSSLTYYEIFFHTLPSFIDKRKNKRFLLVESYDVRYMFSIKDHLLKTFIKLGLPEEKIRNSYGGKHKFDL
jgi:hypothetical protein